MTDRRKKQKCHMCGTLKRAEYWHPMIGERFPFCSWTCLSLYQFGPVNHPQTTQGAENE